MLSIQARPRQTHPYHALGCRWAGSGGLPRHESDFGGDSETTRTLTHTTERFRVRLFRYVCFPAPSSLTNWARGTTILFSLTMPADLTLNLLPCGEAIKVGATFGQHYVDRSESGDLESCSIDVRTRGFLRQSASGHVEFVEPDIFFAAVAAHLAEDRVLLNLEDESMRAIAYKRYRSIASALKKQLSTRKYRADKCADARRKFLDKLSKLNLPWGTCTWASEHPEEVLRKENADLREQVVGLESQVRDGEERLGEVESERDALREENASLRARLEQSERAHAQEMQALRDELTRICSEKDQKILDLEKSLHESLDIIENLEGKLTKRNEAAAKSLQAVFDLEEQKNIDIQKLEDETARLQLRLIRRDSAAKKQAEEIRQLRRKAEALGVENSNLRKGVVNIIEKRRERKEQEVDKIWATAADRLCDAQYSALVHKFLYVKERYHISDAAFHELYMLYQDFGTFPRSHDTTRMRDKFYGEFRNDKGLNLRCTPGGSGHQVDIKEVWRRQIIAALDRGELSLSDVARLRLGVCNSNLLI